VQNDLIDGALPTCADAAEVVPAINALRAEVPWGVVSVCMDWHPAEHVALRTP
jgi:hypothetical protein